MMSLLMRLLVISFPFVFAGVFFWPVIHDRYVQPDPTTEESKLEDFLVFPENNAIPKPKRHRMEARSTETVANNESDSVIYKWVDENGRVVFSDRLTNKKAVAHTLIEIGHISAVGVPRPLKVAAPERPAVVTKAPEVKASVRSRPDFKFSNISAGQKHGYVLLSGRISRGYRCKQLRVVATATSDRGRFVRDSDIVKSRGSGSTLYEMKVRSHWNGNGRRPQWDVGRVSAVCLD